MKSAIAAVLATLLAGCLTPPTGKDPGGGGTDGPPGTDGGGGDVDGGGGGPWPPADVQIHAAAAVDLDGDGKEELLVVADTGGQIELVALDGPTDVRSRATLAGASAPFAVRGFDARMAVAGSDVIVAYTDGGAVSLDAHAGADLARLTKVATGLTPAGARDVWLADVEFVTGSHHAVVHAGGNLRHVRGDTLASGSPTAEMIPPPAGGWMMAQAAGSYDDAGSQRIAVATAASFQTSPLPGPGGSGGDFAWTSPRTGASWSAQQVVDLDGDGRPEVFGTTAGGGSTNLCASDVDAGAQGCAPVGFPVTATLAVGDVTTDAKLDVVAGSSTGAMTHVAVRGGLVYTPGTLTTDPEVSIDVPITEGLVVIANRGVAHEVILTVGTDGAIDCRVEMSMALIPCGPAAGF